MNTATLNVPLAGSNSVNCGLTTTLYDNGGPLANYNNFADGYTVFKNAGTAVITLTGSMSVESNYDFVLIYAGVGTGGTLLASYTGARAVGPITSAAGQPLTVRMKSDNNITYSGFQINAAYSAGCLTQTVRVEIFKQQTLSTMQYGVLVWKSTAKPPNDFLLLKPNLDSTVDAVIPTKQLDLYAGNEKFGPSFNTKCLIMMKTTKYAAEFTFELFNSTLNNYYQTIHTSTGSAQKIYHFLCLASSTSTVLGEFDYVDSLNGLFYSLGS